MRILVRMVSWGMAGMVQVVYRFSHSNDGVGACTYVHVLIHLALFEITCVAFGCVVNGSLIQWHFVYDYVHVGAIALDIYSLSTNTIIHSSTHSSKFITINIVKHSASHVYNASTGTLCFIRIQK